jgi:DNA-binding winged helix-turn-helix (wHTH) protein
MSWMMTRRCADVAEADASLVFDRFRILMLRRQLLADGVPVELGTRAFDILWTLIEANGSLVTKDELARRVWPGISVEESNLKAQVCAVRKALGRDRDLIRTEVGRGYRFVGVARQGLVPWGASPARDAMPERESAPDDDLAKIALRLEQLEIQLAEMRRELAALMQKLRSCTRASTPIP